MIEILKWNGIDTNKSSDIDIWNTELKPKIEQLKNERYAANGEELFSLLEVYKKASDA